MKTSTIVMMVFFLLTASAMSAEYYSPLDWKYEYNAAPNQSIDPHNFFTSGFLRRTSRSVRYHSEAVGVGYAYARPSWYIGTSVSYEDGTVKRRSHSIQNDNSSISLFGGLRSESGWSLDASGTISFATYKSSPLSGSHWLPPGIVARSAKLHHTQAAASLQVAKSFEWKTIDFKAYAGVDYAYLPTEEHNYYGEISGINYLLVSIRLREGRHYLEIPTGVRVSKTFYFGNNSVSPYFDVALIHALKRENQIGATAGFAAITGNGWKVYGNSNDDIGGRFKIGSKMSFNDRFSCDVNYTYEIRQKYSDHQLAVILGVSF